MSKTHISNRIKKQVDAIWLGGSNECPNCHRSLDGERMKHYHHIVWECNGGQTNIMNLMPLCKYCHKRIHSREEASVDANLIDWLFLQYSLGLISNFYEFSRRVNGNLREEKEEWYRSQRDMQQLLDDITRDIGDKIKKGESNE